MARKEKEREFLAGYKSYIMGLSMVLFGIYVMAQGMQTEGWQILLNGLAIMSLRKGIEKAQR